MRRGVGTLASPTSWSHERLAPPPTGDASVPTPLPTSPAPTNVTICPPKNLPLRGRPARPPHLTSRHPPDLHCLIERARGNKFSIRRPANRTHSILVACIGKDRR